MLPALQAAGLDRVNISLDTLDAATFARLTRTDALPRVHGAIDAVLAAGLSPLKINNVLMRDTPGLPGNEHELLDFARLSVDTPIEPWP
jgi:cyclic pyranopterin phosphate synthase